MGLTLTLDRPPQVFGSQNVVSGSIAFDASYPTNGEALTAANLGMTYIDLMLVPNKSGYSFEYDYANAKLKAFYCDYDAVADGAQIEVANTTNLSTLTGVKVIAFGR